MSVIAIAGLMPSWSLTAVGNFLAKVTKERYTEFEVLNFIPNKSDKTKTGYIHISEKLDPVRIVEQINSSPGVSSKLKASIPDRVPDFPLAKKDLLKKLQPDNNPENILPLTHRELMYELQSKFCGLYNLSKKTGHKLLKELANAMFERLTTIISVNKAVSKNCVSLSKAYRKKHPHFGDFQFILSTLHALQDASGAPRAQINEDQLVVVQHHPFMYENIPYDKIQTACQVYSDMVCKSITEHINNLETEMNPEDSEEEVARKKVRTELKKIGSCMGSIVQQVAVKHFIPMRPPFLRIWMYGEPFLPSKEVLRDFLRKHSANYTRRSSWVFNLIRFNIPPRHYWGLMAMDGTVINGAKLVIRTFDTPKYKVSQDVLKEWLSEEAAEFYKKCQTADLEEDQEEEEEIEEQTEE